MLPERVALRRKLVAFLCDTCPELVEALKRTRQVYPGTPTAFHMEDSVWTHTLLVLQSALLDETCTMEDILCALVHDFAKPCAATVKEGKKQPGKKFSFPGHGPMGAQAAVDFLVALRTVEPGIVTDAQLARIAAATSAHIAYYDMGDAESALAFCNGDTALCLTLTRLLKNDLEGCVLDPVALSYKANAHLVDDTLELLSRTSAKEGFDRVSPMTAGPGLHLCCGLSSRDKTRFVEGIAQGRAVLAPREFAVLDREDKNRKKAIRAQGTDASQKGNGEKDSGRKGGDQPPLPPTLAAFVEELPEEGLADGLFLDVPLTTRSARRRVVRALKERFRNLPLTCTFVFSASPESWLPQMPHPSCGLGLPLPVPRLVVPSLLQEPDFRDARIVFASPDGEIL